MRKEDCALVVKRKLPQGVRIALEALYLGLEVEIGNFGKVFLAEANNGSVVLVGQPFSNGEILGLSEITLMDFLDKTSKLDEKQLQTLTANVGLNKIKNNPATSQGREE